MRLAIIFLLFSSIFITACNTISVEISSAVVSTPTVTSTTAIPKPTLTPTPENRPTKLLKSTGVSVTELYLRLVNSRGEPVLFSKAELLLSVWPISFSIPLDTNDDVLVLPLEEKIARELWLKDTLPEDYPHSYFLYVEAEGYAPVRSKEIFFIETQSQPNKPNNEAVIEFYNGPKTKISKGQQLEIELTLRELQERTLQFVDDNQNPVPDVKVRSYMFWSDSNRCRGPDGANFLTEGVSDEKGRVSIPDGDFEYFLELEKPSYHLKIPTDFRPMTLISYLSSQETIVELRRLKKQHLEMIVEKDDKPQANKTLIGWQTGCYCDCEHKIATTDKNGRISLDEFYPEEWKRIYFGEEGTVGIWQADPKELSGTEVIEVELSK